MINQESLDMMDKFTKEQEHPLGTRRIGRHGRPEIYCKMIKPVQANSVVFSNDIERQERI